MSFSGRTVAGPGPDRAVCRPGPVTWVWPQPGPSQVGARSQEAGGPELGGLPAAQLPCGWEQGQVGAETAWGCSTTPHPCGHHISPGPSKGHFVALTCLGDVQGPLLGATQAERMRSRQSQAESACRVRARAASAPTPRLTWRRRTRRFEAGQ